MNDETAAAPPALPPTPTNALSERVEAVREEVSRAFIGQPDVLDQILIALLAGGHVLIEGVPGLGKTLLVRALAQALELAYARVQFTPDLMPSDVSGHAVYDPKTESFQIRRGPVFTNILLADEINRAPAKTQSALLEAMQERQVTIDGETHPLAAPFFVLATQNPLEQEGTYPLPEAQVDRFLLRIVVPYPSVEEEVRILRTYSTRPPTPTSVVALENVTWLQSVADAVHVDDEVYNYAVALAHYTRAHPRIALGASPRASLGIVLAARAWALVQGRGFVIPDDLKRVAAPVLSHRIIPGAEAESEGVTREALVDEALARVPYRRSEARAEPPGYGASAVVSEGAR